MQISNKVLGLGALVAALFVPFAQQGCGQCAAAPVCGEGEVEVDECPEDEDSCYENEICGTTIFCQPQPGQCEAAPTCDGSDLEVQACPSGVDCYERSLCGTTILCQPVSTCAAVPTCDAGDAEINGACPDDAACYEATECGSTILCSDDAEPAHGCPSQEPLTGGACDPATAPAECHYPPCGFYSCTNVNGDFEWTVSGGCGTGGGSP